MEGLLHGWGHLIDRAVNEFFDKDQHTELKPSKKNRTTEHYNDIGGRQLLAFSPVWLTYKSFWPTRDDPIPTVFSRHATAHTVSDDQYTRRNAVQRIVIAVSVLTRFDEQRYSAEEQAL